MGAGGGNSIVIPNCVTPGNEKHFFLKIPPKKKKKKDFWSLLQNLAILDSYSVNVAGQLEADAPLIWVYDH